MADGGGERGGEQLRDVLKRTSGSSQSKGCSPALNNRLSHVFFLEMKRSETSRVLRV